jgi:ubiquinone/menaquinone biosynthesis C-methylase UbiE
MVHIFDPARMGSLTSARRQEAVQPLTLLTTAGLAAGQTVLDLGCGAGFFALPAARLVGPQGRVIAVDVQPEMVQATQQAAQAAGCPNLEVLLAPGAYELPPGLAPVDWVILAYVLHEVAEPGRLLQLAAQALQPAGRMLIVEWPPLAGDHGPPLAERLASAALAAWYEPLGWRQVHYWEGLPEYYALVLARRG